jgi:hypothetical protein
MLAFFERCINQVDTIDCRKRGVPGKQEMLPPRKIAVAEARGSSPPRLSGDSAGESEAPALQLQLVP